VTLKEENKNVTNKKAEKHKTLGRKPKRMFKSEKYSNENLKLNGYI
jgi:hypothetical protein